VQVFFLKYFIFFLNTAAAASATSSRVFRRPGRCPPRHHALPLRLPSEYSWAAAKFCFIFPGFSIQDNVTF
jgi:hypothetical protein